MYAEAAPPWTSTTLASKAGRTVPSAYANERRRTCCSWANPGAVKRVQPSLSVILESEPRDTVRPMLVAALTHAAVGESVAAGTDVALVRTSEEETYWMAPLPTPTVTMLPSAGEGPPKFWRKRTARALLPASFWSLTRVRFFSWSAERPNRVACEPSQARAAATASPEVALPRVPETGEIEAGVPKLFQRTAAASPVAADFCAADGATVPRTSTSSSPARSAREFSIDFAVSRAGAAVAVPGSWLRPARTAVAVATPRSRMDVLGMVPPQGRSTGGPRSDVGPLTPRRGPGLLTGHEFTCWKHHVSLRDGSCGHSRLDRGDELATSLDRSNGVG